MKKAFNKLLQSFNRHGGCCSTLLVCLLASAFMPLKAAASVDFVNQWPATPTIVSISTTAPVSGKFTVGSGTSRLMLVTVATKYSGVQAPTFTVNYGNQAVTMLQNYTAGNNKVWLGYLKETGIAAATSKKLTVTPSTYTNLTALYANCAVFNGVDQTATTFSGSASGGTTVAALTTSPAVAYVNAGNIGVAGNTGMSVYVVNWNNTTVGQTTPSTGYTENRTDYLGTSFSLVANYKVTTGNTSESIISTTTASAIAGLAAVSLNPAAKLATIIAGACGDCHGNPPIDGARNVIAGAFVGSHEKHGGDTDIQYAFACTACHTNNTLTSHSDGFKNISGSKLPRNAYAGTGTPRIAISNSPQNTTCSNTSCHSTGRSNIQYTTTPAWGGASTTCLSCHAGRAGTGNGAQANSSAGFKLSSSHSQHLKYPAASVNCNMCHGSVTSFDGTNLTLKNYSGIIYHANGTPNVVFKDLSYGTYTAFKTVTKTCGNISCHGGKSRSGWQNAAINTTNTCTHCHGQPTTANILPSNTNRKNYAPGWVNGAYTGTSTDQLTADSDFRVGAHFAHLSSMYMKQIKCNECHQVPSNPFDASNNHMTGPRYSSQSITFAQASTATKNGVFTSFTSGTGNKAATCSTTYCHGSKTILGDTAGTNRKPSWNQNNIIARTPSTTACGTCHGFPPSTSASNHSGLTLLSQCNTCHSNVVDASGNIINKTLHINGTNDYLMSCNSCHDYDTNGGTWGLVNNKNYGGTVGVEGRGAHYKHIEYLKAKNPGFPLLPGSDLYGGATFNVICGVCHSTDIAQHTMSNPAGTRAINLGALQAYPGAFGSSNPAYNGLYNTSSGVNPKSCSNIDCHYRTSPIWSTY